MSSLRRVQTARSLQEDPAESTKPDPDPKAPKGSVVPKEPEDAIRRPTFHVKQEYQAKAKQVFDSRMLIDPTPDAFGLNIDAPPGNRTPVLGMKDPKSGDNSLGGSKENDLDKFGHCTPKMGCAPAQMWDRPNLNRTDSEKASQEFETTAVAIEGAQQGTYYGSVKWGWKKEVGGNVEALPFALAKNAAPSETFSDAAKLWNQSSNLYDEKSIPLPLASDKFVSKRSELKLENDKTVVLAPDTPVEKGEQVKDLVKVTVTDGPSKGQTGWLSA